METEENAIGKILIPCGISSAIFGMIYGSVFGFEEWLNPMYEAMGIAGAHGKPIHVMDGATSQLLFMQPSVLVLY